MIERKDVRHKYTGSHVVGCDKLTSQVTLVIELVIDRKELACCRFDLVDKLKRENEEAIRRTLYGDVVQELITLRYDVMGVAKDAPILIDRIDRLIAKLEWRD